MTEKLTSVDKLIEYVRKEAFNKISVPTAINKNKTNIIMDKIYKDIENVLINKAERGRLIDYPSVDPILSSRKNV